MRNPDFQGRDGATGLVPQYEVVGAARQPDGPEVRDESFHGVSWRGDQVGGVGQWVKDIDQKKGRWLDFRIRGLAQDGFVVDGDALKMKIEFFSKNGDEYMDCASRPLYGEIERDRKDLTVNGDYHRGGASVWRTYELEELVPFPAVDAVRISVYTDKASPGGSGGAFLVNQFSLVQHARSVTGKVDPAERIAAPAVSAVDTSKLVPLGGRWFYEPAAGESGQPPLRVTEENADRLFYKSDRLCNPFLKNMTAWLRKGWLDEQGNAATQDTFVPDNVVLEFKGDGFLTVTSKNLPNHPTAKFPGFNPNSIQEMTRTYRLPLEPVIDPQAKSMDDADQNGALPMGPIGIAVNGVVFYNPFDAGMQDASNIMDYCCGHPNPDGQYHYHKYPICVNTPFVDKGAGPSPVIGFAFDGLPIYGPYQEAGVMAKDSTTNPLNAFNACNDQVRGWHYHVTPGKFPYVIGGYFAKVEASDISQGHGPGRPGMRGGGPGGGPPPFDGPPDGPPGGPGGDRPPPPPDGD